MFNVNHNLNNFYCNVDCESHSETSNCKCDGICRCSKITNAKVVCVSINSIVRQIVKDNKLKCSTIDMYCIDRLVRIFKMFDVSKWDIEICNSYYGEEIGKVTFNHYDKVCQVLNEMLKLKTDNEKIEYCLIQEYGYLLDYLKNVNYKESVIEHDSIVHNHEYMKKVTPENFYSDSEYDMIRAIVRPEEGCKNKYRLIDGFHRVISTNSKIKVLIAKKD